MQIFVKTLTGKTITLEVENSAKMSPVHVPMGAIGFVEQGTDIYTYGCNTCLGFVIFCKSGLTCMGHLATLLQVTQLKQIHTILREHVIERIICFSGRPKEYQDKLPNIEERFYEVKVEYVQLLRGYVSGKNFSSNFPPIRIKKMSESEAMYQISTSVSGQVTVCHKPDWLTVLPFLQEMHTFTWDQGKGKDIDILFDSNDCKRAAVAVAQKNSKKVTQEALLKFIEASQLGVSKRLASK